MKSKSADIVIVGGGVIGLSCAFYLARDLYAGNAAGKITIIEKEPVTGAGATGKNAGGIRAQFSSPENIIFSLRSIEAFESFEEETGSALAFNQCGYLFLQSTPEQVKRFEKQAVLQRSLGVDTQFLTPEEILKLAPALKVDDLIRGSFYDRDGIADPGDVAMGYYNAVKRQGVEVLTETTVTGLELSGEAIVGVITNRESIHCQKVINAAGPFAADIAKMADYDLPVVPVKRQIVVTGPLDYINEGFPMVVDVSTGVYFHKETPGLLMGWADPGTEPGYDESTDDDYTDEILMRTLQRLPRLEDAEIGNAWGGLYETTPDHRAIIGNAPGLNGLIFVNGFSGHGLMHAPAAGMVVADLVSGAAPRFDLTNFSPDRFTKGALIHEANII
jgi:glycine/D-amino acid oxidase-like deaminating enzyme